MSEFSSWEFDDLTNTLFIHFDVEEHHIKLDTFIRTADSARRILSSLDQALFDGRLKYELVVLPPEEGSFLQCLKVLIPLAAATVLFFDSDTPAGFIEGLTGKPPSEWAKELGQVTAGGLNEVYSSEDDVNPPKPSETTPISDEKACRAGGRLLTVMTRAVLEMENEQLRRLGMEDGELVEALEARADFYAACYNDHDVKRIGFTADDEFPIPRNSFAGRAQPPARKKDEEESPEWLVAVENISASSPNWDEDDQRTRKWKGKDANRRDCYFVIEDAEFWRHVKKQDLDVEVVDTLKVHWAYRLVDGKAKQRRVLRVLQFNGAKLADPLSPDAVNAILGSHRPTAGAPGERTLFDL